MSLTWASHITRIKEFEASQKWHGAILVWLNRSQGTFHVRSMPGLGQEIIEKRSWLFQLDFHTRDLPELHDQHTHGMHPGSDILVVFLWWKWPPSFKTAKNFLCMGNEFHFHCACTGTLQNNRLDPAGFSRIENCSRFLFCDFIDKCGSMRGFIGISVQ